MDASLVLQAGDGMIDLVRGAGSMAWFLLFVLAIFSVVSWAIIIDRIMLFRKAQRESSEFLETFRNSSKFSQAKSAAEELETTPLSGMFLAGHAELSAQKNVGEQTSILLPPLERGLQRAARAERARLQRLMMFLATTAAVCPFIGLFGTVWGIMVSFSAIGSYGSPDIAVVAPGISAALTTTAAGLAAAIPAVVAYNYLQTQIRGFVAQMEDFGLEFLALIERNFSTEA
ncbi:MAG: MotA/TolQ/ExbB proton channel family protein [Acidobacteriota bacterium]|nr:MotA/TolQ/ExbB proton channel family protein [Acidobacteriota bacterium]